MACIRTVGEHQQATGSTAAPSFPIPSFPVLARVRAGARGEAQRPKGRWLASRSASGPCAAVLPHLHCSRNPSQWPARQARARHSPPRQTLVPPPDDESLRPTAWLRHPLPTSLNAPGRHPRQGVRVRRVAAVACADPSGTCRGLSHRPKLRPCQAGD